MTDVLRDARVSEVSDPATQPALATTEAELRAAFALFRSEMHIEFRLTRAQIAKSRTDTIKWMAGLLLVQGGFIIALIRLLQGH